MVDDSESNRELYNDWVNDSADYLNRVRRRTNGRVTPRGAIPVVEARARRRKKKITTSILPGQQ